MTTRRKSPRGAKKLAPPSRKMAGQDGRRRRPNSYGRPAGSGAETASPPGRARAAERGTAPDAAGIGQGHHRAQADRRIPCPAGHRHRAGGRNRGHHGRERRDSLRESGPWSAFMDPSSPPSRSARAPAWACRWCMASSSRTRALSPWKAMLAGAPHSASFFPPKPSPKPRPTLTASLATTAAAAKESWCCRTKQP